MEPNPNKQNQKPLNSYAKYSSLGIQMVLIIGGGCYAGYKLDEYFKNTETPIYTIILSLVSNSVVFLNNENQFDLNHKQ